MAKVKVDSEEELRRYFSELGEVRALYSAMNRHEEASLFKGKQEGASEALNILGITVEGING